MDHSHIETIIAKSPVVVFGKGEKHQPFCGFSANMQNIFDDIFPEYEMVMSNGKSKGYSKKAIGLWNKMGRDAKALNDEAMKLLLSKDLENGTLKAQEADVLKDARNKSESYDSIREAYEDIKHTITEA